MNHLIEDFDDLINTLLNSNYSTFTVNLKRLLRFLENEEISKLIRPLPEELFKKWYEEVSRTNNGLTGSGELTWPEDKIESLSLRIALLKSIAKGDYITIPHFCEDFMWSENNFDVMTFNFNDQIVKPITTELRKIIIRSSTLNGELQVSPNNFLINDPIERWYHRPIGTIGIGLFVTIVGGVFASKFLAM